MNRKTFFSAVLFLFFGIAIIGTECKIKANVLNLKTVAIEEVQSISVEQLIVKLLPVKGTAVNRNSPVNPASPPTSTPKMS